MGDFFGGLNPIKAFLNRRKVVLDNSIFQLHSKVTVSLLISCGLLVSSKQFFGEPIKCVSGNSDIAETINYYCWIHGTHTQDNRYERRIPGVNAISKYVGHDLKNDEDLHHMYYQWVCVMLFIQAFMFYIPKYLWKIFECQRLRMLTTELDCPIAKLDSWNEKSRNDLIDYFLDMKGHNFYFFKFSTCELLNFVNVILQIVLLNIFLGGSFTDYGPAATMFFFNLNITKDDNPMEKVFPKVSKCAFNYYGSSGSVQYIDSLCVLPLNVINEKIFIVIWYWFIILSIVSAVALIYRLVTFNSRYLRTYILMRQVYLIPKYKVKNIVQKLNIGDWFLLHQISKNVNPIIFKDLILELDVALEKKTTFI